MRSCTSQRTFLPRGTLRPLASLFDDVARLGADVAWPPQSGPGQSNHHRKQIDLASSSVVPKPGRHARATPHHQSPLQQSAGHTLVSHVGALFSSVLL